MLLLAASSPRALAGQILKTVWKNTKISIINYYLDSTNYRLTKTKTNKLTQRLAEFSYMHAYHSFQSELCFGCLERKSGIVQSLSSASSQFRIADP